MRNIHVRILSLVICAAMLFGMIPGRYVHAEEIETEPTEMVTTDTSEPSSDDEVEGETPEETPISTSDEFLPDEGEDGAAPADLDADADVETGARLAPEASSSETENEIPGWEPVVTAQDGFTQAEFLEALETDVDEYGNYYLTQSVTLEESLTISDVTIYVEDGVILTVSPDVTLTLNSSSLTPWEGGTIDVMGTIDMHNMSSIQVTGGALIVHPSAQVNINDGMIGLSLNDTASIYGLDTKLINAWAYPDNEEELKTALSTPDIYAYVEVIPQEGMVLSESLTVPSHIALNILSMTGIYFEIPAGVTLTNNGRVILQQAQLYIAEGGTFVNNGSVSYNANSEIVCSGTWEGNEPNDNSAPSTPSGSTFSTFDELKALIATGTDSYIQYTGNDDLVISESMTIPETSSVDCDGSKIIVPEGVTLTVYGDLFVQDMEVSGSLVLDECEFGLQVDTLTVSGNCQVNKTTVNVATTLSVSGSMDLYDGYLCYEGSTQTSGLENVSANGYSSIIVDYFIVDDASFAAAVAAEATNEIDHKESWLRITSDVSLSGTYTIPDSSYVNINATLTLAEGCNLTNNGQITVNEPGTLTIEEGATLNNQGMVGVFGTLVDNGTWEGYPAEFYTPSPSGFFSSFEELKEAANYDGDYKVMSYVGEDPLVITESLELPSGISLQCWDSKLVVPEGVTFRHNGDLYAQELEVHGTLRCNYADISDSISVTGTVECEGTFWLDGDAQVSGYENIVAVGYGSIGVRYDSVFSETELAATLDKISASPYSNATSVVSMGSSFTLTDNYVLPYGISMNAESNVLTVAEGCTLTIAPEAYFSGSLVVKGNLVNNGRLGLYYYDYEGGVAQLEVAPGATYSGQGIIRAFGNTAFVPADVIFGVDLEKFDCMDYSTPENNWYNYELLYAGDLTQLATPTELEWGMKLEYDWDENGNLTITRIPGRPTNVSWKNHRPYQGSFLIYVYQENGDNDICVSTWNVSRGIEFEEYIVEEYAFGAGDYETGYYYFTVQAIGDRTQYRNSDVAVSELWYYTKPDTALGIPTNLGWNGMETSFDPPEDTTYVGGYIINFYFSDKVVTDENDPSLVGAGGLYTYYINEDYTLAEILPDWAIQNNGNGYYYYCVKALSSDITQCCNGKESGLSEPLYLTATSNQVKEELDSIISDESATVEEKVEAVQNMDTESLKTAMLADNTVVEQIVELEEAAGGAASVVVNDDASAFAESDISIIGANLNVPADAAEGITLVVDKPEEDHIIPENYNNSVAVSFSMDLENVEDTENLDVPVQITLPVPTTINPDFLVILHYHTATGEPEVIHPYIYWDNGQYYAEFVLTSFSDFVMTEIAQSTEVVGDLDGDGIVSDTDVEYLLWYTLFPDLYPITADADYDGDGVVSDIDVEYLLWHTLFPDLYPL